MSDELSELKKSARLLDKALHNAEKKLSNPSNFFLKNSSDEETMVYEVIIPKLKQEETNLRRKLDQITKENEIKCNQLDAIEERINKLKSDIFSHEEKLSQSKCGYKPYQTANVENGEVDTKPLDDISNLRVCTPSPNLGLWCTPKSSHT